MRLEGFLGEPGVAGEDFLPRHDQVGLAPAVGGVADGEVQVQVLRAFAGLQHQAPFVAGGDAHHHALTPQAAKLPAEGGVAAAADGGGEVSAEAEVGTVDHQPGWRR